MSEDETNIEWAAATARRVIAGGVDVIGATLDHGRSSIIEMARALVELHRAAERVVTLADEAFGMFPVEHIESTITRIEDGIFMMRMDMQVLEAQNQNLRAYIAASKECADAGALLESEAERDRVIALMRDAVSKLTAGAKISAAACSYCDAKWLTGVTIDEIRALAEKHDQSCPSNPLRMERNELLAALLDVCDTQLRRREDAIVVRAIRSTANYSGGPFSMERARALACEWLAKEPKQ